MNILLCIFTALSILIICPNIKDNFWLIKNITFITGGFITISLSWYLAKLSPIRFKNIWLISAFGWLILSFFWYFLKPLLFVTEGQKIIWNAWNLIPTLTLVVSILLIKTLVEHTDNDNWIIISRYLIYISMIVTLYALLQFFGIDQMKGKYFWQIEGIANWKNRMASFFGNKMEVSNFVACVSPLCLMFKTLRYKIFYALSFIIVALTDSTSSFIAFFAGLISYLLITGKFRKLAMLAITLTIASIFAFIYYPDFFSLSSKFAIVKTISPTLLAKPFTGNGLGSMAILHNYFNEGGVVINTTKFNIVDLWHEGGLILVILLICYLITLFRKLYRIGLDIMDICFLSGFLSYLSIVIFSMGLQFMPLIIIGIYYISFLEYKVSLQGG